MTGETTSYLHISFVSLFVVLFCRIFCVMNDTTISESTNNPDGDISEGI